MPTTRKPRYTLEIEAPANGSLGKATVVALNRADKTVFTGRANLTDDTERRRLAKRMGEELGIGPARLLKQLETLGNEATDQRRHLREQAAAGSAEAVAVESVQLLDLAPLTVRRPLCLVGGRSYAAAWVPVQRSVSQSAEGGAVVKHDPPLVSVEDALLVVTGDGRLYADKGVPGGRPLAELGLPVRLPMAPPPGRGWSGAGVKRFLAGERPGPADVFGRAVSVVNRFVDFARSLAPQEAVCDLVACYVLGTYLLDAFHVVGYLWPNGERGTGKTICLNVIAEMAYLGQVILGGSSYACLRDLADYGACLCFDDAEAVMDVKRTDPDKRTLLLAGNRRGATVTVKELEGERWVTRHVDTFCPRSFSAIRLPDEVLASRSIVVPLVRSGDPRRAKAECLDPADWPCDRRRLVDDLWALGLAYLPDLPGHDRAAAAGARLAGRNLDPWRLILGVAHWLQHGHGVAELYDRMEALAVSYQADRGEAEAEDRTRVLFRALVGLVGGQAPGQAVAVRPGDVAEAMNKIAAAEDLTEADKPFTTSRKVGWLLKRQRFRRGEADEHGKTWELTRREIEDAARSYGVDVPGDAPF